MFGAAGASSDAPDILVALGGVLCKVDPCPKHPTDVGVALVKPMVDDVMDERGTCSGVDKRVCVVLLIRVM